MKIAVCLICYNGVPYIDTWMKHYTECPDIDYVLVVDGATQNMMYAMFKEGIFISIYQDHHSKDGTVNILRKYQDHPKATILVSESPCVEKVDQQNVYMELVPDDTDYIFICDVDEFYHYADIASIKKRLEEEKFTYVEFQMYHFFKNINTIGVGGEGWGYDQPIDRIFKYHPGAKFSSHRPITLLNQEGVNVKDIKPLLYTDNPIMCYHYSYITEKNVYEKMLYYTKTFGRDYINLWYNPVWKAWSEETKDEIEAQYSTHPTVKGATTKHVNLIHPIDITKIT